MSETATAAPPHRFGLRVYYEDTDAAGIVYYANFLKFAERARTEFVRAIGLEQRRLWQQEGLGFAVRRCAIEYFRPAHLDDWLEVRTNLVAARGATIRLIQRLYRDELELARLDVEVACLDRAGKPARLPALLRQALDAAAPAAPGEPFSPVATSGA